MGSYKSNKPCDFVSLDGSPRPWHGTPGIVPINRIEETPILGQKRPRTWEDLKVDIDKNKDNKMALDNSTPTLLEGSDLNFDNCNHSEVIKFLQRMAKDPHTSTLNMAFTEHITNALVKAREERLRLEVSIPRKLEDGWDPTIVIE